MTKPRATFGKHEHLRRPSDFRLVYEHRTSAADAHLVVYVRPNDLAHARLGLSVSRKVGGAVLRNRWRRLLREAFRLTKADLPQNVDLVLVARTAVIPPLETLKQSLAALSAAAVHKIKKRG